MVTADFCYYRYRKPSYTADERRAMVDRIRELLGQERNVFAYFKHEETPEGALYAEEILKEFINHGGHRGHGGKPTTVSSVSSVVNHPGYFPQRPIMRILMLCLPQLTLAWSKGSSTI